MLNQSLHNFASEVITYHGVKLRCSLSFSCYYNLSQVKNEPYRIKANGYYIISKPILEPLEWVKSKEGCRHIRKLYSKTEDILYITYTNPRIIYTTSYYVWLGYLKHCIGNIDTAIKAELAC